VYYPKYDKWLCIGEHKIMDDYPHMVMPAPAYCDYPVEIPDNMLFGWYGRMSSYFIEPDKHFLSKIDDDMCDWTDRITLLQWIVDRSHRRI